jgi:selenophosphate synthetase-related protein
VAGNHFLPDIDPADLAYKALAVNLSDLAAMGAEPAWLTPRRLRAHRCEVAQVHRQGFIGEVGRVDIG